MEQPVRYQAATASAGGNCVEVDFSTSGLVRVRNSRRQERVATMGRSDWDRLVAQAQAEGQLDFSSWFPPEKYGEFAESFTADELQAFQQGILTGDTRVTGAN